MGVTSVSQRRSDGPSAEPHGSALTSTRERADAGMRATLRQRYESDVRALVDERLQLQVAGWDVERIARYLHRRRRRIGLIYKLRTPLGGPQGQIAIYRRNLRVYGHVLGPSIEWLRQRGRTWDEICESACRPGGRDVR